MNKLFVTFTILAAVAAQTTTTTKNTDSLNSATIKSPRSNINLPTSTHPKTNSASTTSSPNIINNPTDAKILSQIEKNHKGFAKAADDAIADLDKKNKNAAKAAKKSLGGKDKVPKDYNEKTIKALLTAAPEILTYKDVWDIINKEDPSKTKGPNNFEFANTKTSASNHKSGKSSSNKMISSNLYEVSLLGVCFIDKDIYRCVSNTDLVPNLLRKKLVGEFLGGELKISVSVIRKKENVRSVNMTLATASFLTLIHTSRLLILERISVSPAPMNQSHHGTASLEGQEGIG
ncbi:hypothetical protein BB561_001856 [Smittium simulii]|uniref:Uncharacterized protein n=1 Tax=Smittium simulii TaxID=133385 RepID=A0A2T9YSP9_9FUNG|nr:hypothetical protein BB561_001856 [Smittium simulii]